MSIVLMTSAEEIKQYEGYKLVWNEEFNVDGKLNSEDWKFEEGFSRNHELQWYQADNAFCKDGKLVIVGLRKNALTLINRMVTGAKNANSLSTLQLL